MEDFKFCFSQNLSYFFRSRYNMYLDNWLLYLSMDPIGFSYFGMSDNKTILNGLKADLDDCISLAEKCFRFKQYNVNHSFAEETVWLTPHILRTEDYFLPYHPSYKVNYSERFIITIEGTNQGYKIFDKELQWINGKDLEEAVSSVFLFTKPDIENMDNIQKKLVNKFLQKEQMFPESSKSALQRFWHDFCSNQRYWSKENYKSLYFFITNLAGPRSMFKAQSLALYRLAEEYTKIDTNINISIKYRAQLCEKISDEWNTIGALCFKYAHLNKSKTLESIQRRLEEVMIVLNHL